MSGARKKIKTRKLKRTLQLRRVNCNIHFNCEQVFKSSTFFPLSGFGEEPPYVCCPGRGRSFKGTNKRTNRKESTVGNGKCLSQIKCYTRSSKATSGITNLMGEPEASNQIEIEIRNSTKGKKIVEGKEKQELNILFLNAPNFSVFLND